MFTSRDDVRVLARDIRRRGETQRSRDAEPMVRQQLAGFSNVQPVRVHEWDLDEVEPGAGRTGNGLCQPCGVETPVHTDPWQPICMTVSPLGGRLRSLLRVDDGLDRVRNRLGQGQCCLLYTSDA